MALLPRLKDGKERGWVKADCLYSKTDEESMFPGSCMIKPIAPRSGSKKAVRPETSGLNRAERSERILQSELYAAGGRAGFRSLPEADEAEQVVGRAEVGEVDEIEEGGVQERFRTSALSVQP